MNRKGGPRAGGRKKGTPNRAAAKRGEIAVKIGHGEWLLFAVSGYLPPYSGYLSRSRACRRSFLRRPSTMERVSHIPRSAQAENFPRVFARAAVRI
jgi:hypothetical protein